MPRGRPNVLLILTDQQRWDCVGANGNPVIRTPNADVANRLRRRLTEWFLENPAPCRHGFRSHGGR